MQVAFTDQSGTCFTALLDFENTTGAVFEVERPMRFFGEGFTYAEDDTPLDGVFGRITFETIYVLNEGGVPVTIPGVYYTGAPTDLSDVLDQSSSPEQAVSLLMFGISLSASLRLEDKIGIFITAEAAGGPTMGTRDNDVIQGGEDASRFNAGWGDDYMAATVGAVRFKGQAENDHLIGGEEVDILRRGSGNDPIEGGAGNDKIYCQSGNDGVRGGDGNDWVLRFGYG